MFIKKALTSQSQIKEQQKNSLVVLKYMSALCKVHKNYNSFQNINNTGQLKKKIHKKT